MSTGYFLAAVSVLKRSPHISIVGVHHMYFFDRATGLVMFSAGYVQQSRHPATNMLFVGPRLLRTSVLNRLNWSLWEDDRNSGMDSSSVRVLNRNYGERGLSSMTHAFTSWNVRKGVVVINIKSSSNLSITPFSRYISFCSRTAPKEISTKIRSCSLFDGVPTMSAVACQNHSVVSSIEYPCVHNASDCAFAKLLDEEQVRSALTNLVGSDISNRKAEVVAKWKRC